jgi:hypothetical protein
MSNSQTWCKWCNLPYSVKHLFYKLIHGFRIFHNITPVRFKNVTWGIPLFSEIINGTIIYRNRQEHSTLPRNCQQNYLIHKSFVYMIALLTISEESWMFLTICIYDSTVDNFWGELNFLDDLLIREFYL